MDIDPRRLQPGVKALLKSGYSIDNTLQSAFRTKIQDPSIASLKNESVDSTTKFKGLYYQHSLATLSTHDKTNASASYPLTKKERFRIRCWEIFEKYSTPISGDIKFDGTSRAMPTSNLYQACIALAEKSVPEIEIRNYINQLQLTADALFSWTDFKQLVATIIEPSMRIKTASTFETPTSLSFFSDDFSFHRSANTGGLIGGGDLEGSRISEAKFRSPTQGFHQNSTTPSSPSVLYTSQKIFLPSSATPTPSRDSLSGLAYDRLVQKHRMASSLSENDLSGATMFLPSVNSSTMQMENKVFPKSFATGVIVQTASQKHKQEQKKMIKQNQDLQLQQRKKLEKGLETTSSPSPTSPTSSSKSTHSLPSIPSQLSLVKPEPSTISTGDSSILNPSTKRDTLSEASGNSLSFSSSHKSFFSNASPIPTAPGSPSSSSTSASTSSFPSPSGAKKNSPQKPIRFATSSNSTASGSGLLLCPLLKDRIQTISQTQLAYPEKWRRMKAVRDEREEAKIRRIVGGRAIHSLKNLVIHQECGVLVKAVTKVQRDLKEEKRWKHDLQAEKDKTTQNHIEMWKEEEKAQKALSAARLKNAIEVSTQLSRELKEQDIEEKTEYAASTRFQITSATSTMVDLPEQLRKKIKAALKLPHWRLDRNEELLEVLKEKEAYQQQVIESRIHEITSLKSASILQSISKGGLVSSLPLKGSDYFSDPSSSTDTPSHQTYSQTLPLQSSSIHTSSFYTSDSMQDSFLFSSSILSSTQLLPLSLAERGVVGIAEKKGTEYSMTENQPQRGREIERGERDGGRGGRRGLGGSDTERERSSPFATSSSSSTSSPSSHQSPIQNQFVSNLQQTQSQTQSQNHNNEFNLGGNPGGGGLGGVNDKGREIVYENEKQQFRTSESQNISDVVDGNGSGDSQPKEGDDETSRIAMQEYFTRYGHQIETPIDERDFINQSRTSSSNNSRKEKKWNEIENMKEGEKQNSNMNDQSLPQHKKLSLLTTSTYPVVSIPFSHATTTSSFSSNSASSTPDSSKSSLAPLIHPFFADNNEHSTTHTSKKNADLSPLSSTNSMTKDDRKKPGMKKTLLKANEPRRLSISQLRLDSSESLV